jgi:hypothetical protein
MLGTRFTNAISCFEPGPQEPNKEQPCRRQCSRVSFKKVPVMLLGTRFTNAISCIEPGPQVPCRNSRKYWAIYNVVLEPPEKPYADKDKSQS